MLELEAEHDVVAKYQSSESAKVKYTGQPNLNIPFPPLLVPTLSLSIAL